MLCKLPLHLFITPQNTENPIYAISDDCNNPNDETGYGDTAACSYLTVIPAATANECKIDPVVIEDIKGPMAKLPG